VSDHGGGFTRRPFFVFLETVVSAGDRTVIAA